MEENGSVTEQVANLEKAANEKADDSYKEVAKEEMKLERARINAEERMNERNAERDEHVAEQYSDADKYKTMLDEMFSRFGELFNRVGAQTEVHVEHEANSEIPAVPATEDAETEAKELPTQAIEGIEEIGGETEKAAETTESNVENTVEENTNAPTRKRGRKKRRS